MCEVATKRDFFSWTVHGLCSFCQEQYGASAALRAVGSGGARERAQFWPQAETELSGLCDDDNGGCIAQPSSWLHVLSNGTAPPTIHFEMRESIMPENINEAAGQALTPPRHIAIIMDGNGRWATKRGLPRTAGHKAGAETFRRIATYCKNIGVKYLTVYAFSTENWKRSETEVSAIMALLKRYLLEAVDTMEKDHIRLHFFGDMTPIAPDLRALARETDEITEHLSKDDFQANVCLNYGGRDEILRAARRFAADCAAGEKRPEELDDALFSSYLDSAGIPDPELIIRPSGEQRLSNFLLWQCAYSEFYYTDTLWPDFDETELDRAIAAYQQRDRRFGGVKK